MAKLLFENGRLDEAKQIALQGIKTVNDTECLEKFAGWIHRMQQYQATMSSESDED